MRTVSHLVPALTPVGAQIPVVPAPVAAVSAKIVTVTVLGAAVAPKVRAIAMGAPGVAAGTIAPEIAAVGATARVVQANVSAVPVHIAPVAPEISPVGPDVARIVAHLTGPLGAHGCLCVRDGRGSGGKRKRGAKGDQCVAKHGGFLQNRWVRDLGCAPYEEVDVALGRALRI